VTQPDDEDLLLTADFERLRAATERAGRVPDFGDMLQRARIEAAALPDVRVLSGDGTVATRRKALRFGGWASAALAAAIAAILLTGGRTEADREFDRLVATYSSELSAGALRSPTSALLDVPGRNLTRSVPSLGTTTRGLDPSRVPDVPAPDGRDS
jgi:hypothetical protein